MQRIIQNTAVLPDGGIFLLFSGSRALFRAGERCDIAHPVKHDTGPVGIAILSFDLN